MIDTDFPRSTGTVPLDLPAVDMAERSERLARLAVAKSDEESGRAAEARAAAERLERAALDEELRRATSEERDVLYRARHDLETAQRTVVAAEAAVAAARGLEALAAADDAVAAAKRTEALAVRAIAAIENDIVARVRGDRRSQATADLAEIASRWRAVSKQLLASYDAIAELGRLREAEQAAATDLATASGKPSTRWSTTHGRAVPIKHFGAEYLRMPDLRIEVAIDGANVTQQELAERLGI